ncbi:penicillin acylase family protein [Larkinella soli]|uniref:penicillin acylase family protein n=1 Tax=Larkinella soli TaxID=1770527 RepID=UPI000FFCA2A6|nr:penicillin acylase family protein [Larkinella soli]
MTRVPAFLLFLLTVVPALSQPFRPAEVGRWQEQAKKVTIIRDNWGVPHIYGKTDADVVFGLLYSQCEDDFARVEANYIDAVGRMAEVEGESALYHDLRARLFLDSAEAVSLYRKSPSWLRKLLDAFADGANFYLATHPQVKPRLLTRFQPWMPLMFSEGSIGGNISAVSTERLKAFYTHTRWTSVVPDFDQFEREPVGSNGFAVAPSKSATGHPLLLINPHTSFYFRSEVHLVSEQGLNAYGAVTWGQFFVYQGFNENCGWMHTSSNADTMDEFLETIEKKDGKYFYRYGNEWRPVTTETVTLPFKEGNEVKRKEFTLFRTHHGPVAGLEGDRWVSIGMMNDPIHALEQSYLRTKSTDYASYRKVMKLNGNSSNNTVFADRKGIAYWHGNFMPKRDPAFDWNNPVDGSNPRTDWKGLHGIDEVVQVHNPAVGWIQNCNSTPFTVSGPDSPDPKRYPSYMAPDAENYRGINAVRVLSRKSVFTLDTLIAAANDPYLAAFDDLLPGLISAYEEQSAKVGTQPEAVAEAVGLLKSWNRHYGVNSIPTTLAIYWAEQLYRLARTRTPKGQRFNQLTFNAFAIKATTAQEKLTALAEAQEQLIRDFGTWKTPWGEINRFQRLTGEIDQKFDDSRPSLPVGFTPSVWGSLAAFGTNPDSGTKKRYGVVGNSFVAVVEFGKRVKARTVMTGGQSSDPTSPHFTDQAPLYTIGRFKDVHFYPEEVKSHAERTYHPGNR